MKLLVGMLAVVLLTGVALPIVAQDPSQGPNSLDHARHRKHGAALSFKQLRATVSKLIRARKATAKYLDMRAAKRDGYQAIGPYVPGMGVHYVRSDLGEQSVDLEHPPILLYEKDPKGPEGYRLVGVSYLLDTPAASNGQPLNSPFPEALASWHKHYHVCVLPDHDATLDLTKGQCADRKGEFIAETPWMMHAWIWQDSPAGVFSFTNPTVR